MNIRNSIAKWVMGDYSFVGKENGKSYLPDFSEVRQEFSQVIFTSIVELVTDIANDVTLLLKSGNQMLFADFNLFFMQNGQLVLNKLFNSGFAVIAYNNAGFVLVDDDDYSLAFINIAGNVRADDVVNSLGACNDRYVNECNTWSKSSIEKLMINNTGQMYFDFNPYKDFWISELITDKNFLKTTWRDNPFLTKAQTDLFLQWVEEGQKAEFGTYKYWRWQVMCEGNFCQMLGAKFSPENLHFCSKVPDSVNLHSYIIFADPSDAKGGDYFALTLTALGDDGNVYLLDSFSSNMIGKVMIAEKIKEWQRDYPIAYTYIETNGAYGTKFYNDCITSQMEVSGWYSRKDKFERIMSNFDVITDKLYIVENEANNNFLQQVYTFDEDCEHDDNIDCLNNALMAYILVMGELKTLF